MPFRPAVEQWRSPIRRFGGDLPIDFVLAWIEKESGGNPCATGIAGVEAGIVQTFHPHDDRFGLSFAQLRAPCAGGSQSQARAVTDDEIIAFARQAATFIRGKRDVARAHLAAVGARWSESSADFWNAVKQEHALPCVMGDLLPRVTMRLGRPPRSWGEFKAVIAQMSPPETGSCAGFAAAPSLHGLRNRLEDTLKNAEETGQFGAGFLGGPAGILIKLALVGVIGWAAYKIWTAGERPTAVQPPGTTT